MAFSFGAGNKPAFGATTTSAGGNFGFGTGFGQSAATSTAAGGGGLLNLSTATTTTASTGFSFGAGAGAGAGTGGTTGFGTGGTTGFGTGTTGFGTGTTGFSAGGTTGFNPGTTGFNTGTTGFNPGTTGFNPGTTGFNTGTTGFNTGTTGFNTGTTGFNTGTTGFNTGTTTGTFGAGTTAGTFGTPGAASGGLFGTSTSTTPYGGNAPFGSTGSTFGAAGTGMFSGTTGAAGTGTFGGTAGAGFGTTGGTALGATGSTGFGAQAAAQPSQQQSTAVAISNMGRAVSIPMIFGDERDAIIAKWNQLQAFWGSGKGYFSQQGEFVNFAADNPFCRFKAVGYSCIPISKNESGMVGFIFAKKLADVQSNQQQIIDVIQKLLASSNTMLTVCVEDVKALPDNKTEIILYLQERAANGHTRRIPASDVYKAITGNVNIKQQLGTQLSVENLLPKIGFGKEKLKQYLDHPPAGIDGRIWQQAKLDNPDPSRFIPVPMIGFTELHNRLMQQEQQTGLHQKRLDMIASDIAALQRNHGDMLSKIDEYKRRYLELSHRVLQVMVKQEIYRRMGYVIQADEEQLRTQFEMIQAELNAPTRFKGRLNELMSQLRMQNQLGGMRSEASYDIDSTVQQEIRQHLKQQQEGIQHLITVIKDDLDDLNLIEVGMTDINKHKR